MIPICSKTWKSVLVFAYTVLIVVLEEFGFTCYSRTREGNGTPLQYSCLANPMDGGAWWAAVHEIAELDTTEWLQFHFSLSCIGEGNGNPLQCSCLENPRDRGAWRSAVYGVAQSRTWWKSLSSLKNYWWLPIAYRVTFKYLSWTDTASFKIWSQICS